MPGHLLEQYQHKLPEDMDNGGRPLPPPPQGTNTPGSIDDNPMPTPNTAAASPDALSPVKNNNILVTPPHSAALPLSDLADSMKQLPPELQHITENYQPLSTLFTRSAQECHNKLIELITDLQDFDTLSQINGNRDSGNNPRDLNSDEKRRRWLQFAKTQRDQFLAMWVIFQWGRHSKEPVSTLIDVFNWLRQRNTDDELVQEYLALLRRDVADFKLRTPDINTALQILTNNLSPAEPNPRYYPPPTLNAKEILHHLQDINILLHIRVNLHENLPPHLRKFRIHSGRITFILPTEFELDVSIIDEEPDSRFYFVDFRFLFTPNSEIPPGALRFDFENTLNAILASQGLAVCIDFLHEYVISYKLSIFRRQALELAIGSWGCALNVQGIHRSTFVSYWTGRSGKKNWIELGMHSGLKNGEHHSEETCLSKVQVKWTSYGKDMSTEFPVVPDLQNLNLETLMTWVIKKHCLRIFNTTFDNLKRTLPAAAASKVRLSTKLENVADWVLTVPLYSTPTATIHIQPHTGCFTIFPLNPTNSKTEQILNALTNPVESLASRIISWRHQDATISFQNGALSRYWEVRRIGLDISQKREIFSDPNAAPTFYRRWHDPKWVLVVLPDGGSWYGIYIMELSSPPVTAYDLTGSMVIHTCKKLDMKQESLSKQFYIDLERTAMATISATVFQRRLRELNISFTPASGDKSIFAPVHIELQKVGDLMSKTLIFAHRKISAGRRGIAKTDMISLIARGTLKAGGALSHMRSSIKSSSIAFDASGSFSLAFEAPVGATNIADGLISEVERIARVHSFIDAVFKQNWKANFVSLNSLSFEYGGSQTLTACVTWPQGKLGHLELSPSGNPHLRLIKSLQNFVKNPNALPATLATTLPVMRAIDVIEAKKQVEIHILDTHVYYLSYLKPRCALKIRYRPHWTQNTWHISADLPDPTNRSKTEPTATNAKLLKQWQVIFDATKATADGVTYFNGTGVAATFEKVEAILLNVDEQVRASYDPSMEPKPQLEAVTSNSSSNELESVQFDSSGTGQQKGQTKSKAMPVSGSASQGMQKQPHQNANGASMSNTVQRPPNPSQHINDSVQNQASAAAQANMQQRFLQQQQQQAVMRQRVAQGQQNSQQNQHVPQPMANQNQQRLQMPSGQRFPGPPNLPGQMPLANGRLPNGQNMTAMQQQMQHREIMRRNAQNGGLQNGRLQNGGTQNPGMNQQGQFPHGNHGQTQNQNNGGRSDSGNGSNGNGSGNGKGKPPSEVIVLD